MATKFSDFIEDSYQNVTSNGYIAGYYTNEVQKTNVRVSFSSLSDDIESKTSGTWSATQYYLDDDGTTASREIFYNPSDDIDTEEVDFVSNDYMKHYTSGVLTGNMISANYNTTNKGVYSSSVVKTYNPSAGQSFGSTTDHVALESYVNSVSSRLDFNNQSSTSGVLTENLVSATWDSEKETMTSAGFTNSYNPSANTTIATNTDPIALKSYVDSIGNKLELKSTYTYVSASGELPTNPTKKQKSYIWIVGNETDTGVDKTYEYVWDSQKNAFVKIGMMRNDFSGTLSAKKYSSDTITANLSYNPLNTGADWGDLASTAFVNYRTSGVLKVSAKTATTAANYGVTTSYVSTSYNPSADSNMASLVGESYLTAISSSLDSKMGSKTSGVLTLSSITAVVNNTSITTGSTTAKYNPSASQTATLATLSYISAVSSALDNKKVDKTDLDNSKWQSANANTIQPKDNSGISATSGRIVDLSATTGKFGSVTISSDVVKNTTGSATFVTNSPTAGDYYFLTGTSVSAMGLSKYTAPDSSRWSANGNNTIVPKDKSGISATSGQFGNIDISGDVINNSTATAVMVKSTTLDSTKCYFLTGSNLSAMGLSAYTIPDGSKWSAEANTNYLWAKDNKNAVAQYLDGGNSKKNKVSASYVGNALKADEIKYIAAWKTGSDENSVATIKDASKSGVKEYLGLPQQPMSSTTWANFITATKESDTIYLVY
ncbi:MAG: hypothetical protein MJZ34_05315 [Paludibacteraceae bacterium]|nr:hypothetical protein [Paludibacteraceae bacterium]